MQDTGQDQGLLSFLSSSSFIFETPSTSKVWRTQTRDKDVFKLAKTIIFVVSAPGNDECDGHDHVHVVLNSVGSLRSVVGQSDGGAVFRDPRTIGTSERTGLSVTSPDPVVWLHRALERHFLVRLFGLFDARVLGVDDWTRREFPSPEKCHDSPDEQYSHSSPSHLSGY